MGHSRSHPLRQRTEFVAKAVQEWIAVAGAKTAYIERGSPWENGYIESFDARLHDELLDGEISTRSERVKGADDSKKLFPSVSYLTLSTQP